MRKISEVGDIKKKRFLQVLALLYFGPMKQKEIVKILGLSKSWVSQLTKELREQNLIEVKEQGRTHILKMTKEGEEFYQKQKAISRSTVENLVKRLLNKLKIKYEKSVRVGSIRFDYNIPQQRKSIRIIDGIPRLDEEILKAMDKYLERGYRPGHIRSEITKILRTLIDEKGALLSIIRLAANQRRKILIIIIGDNPQTWPEIQRKIINKIGELEEQEFAIGAPEALRQILADKPENIEIIFTGQTNPEELSNRIKKFLLSND